VRITATVEVDMTRFVQDRCLYFGDREVQHLYRYAPVAAPVGLTIRIGDAVSVVWDERSVDALVGAQSVAVVGSSLRGVESAMAALQAQFEARAA
jgi:hypothetical protein